jgi:PAS domain S-box-containing protein
MKNEKRIKEGLNAEDEILNTLKNNEVIFHSYFNMPLHGIAITSPNKGWVQVNDKLCEMLGYTREEILKMTWLEMTHPDDIAADEKLFNQVIAGKIDSYNLSKRFIKKDGSIIWTSLSVGCVRKKNKEVEYIIALLKDTTEHKKEEELLKSRTALLEAQLNATIDGILVVDQNKKRVLINQKFIELFNIPQRILDDKNQTVLLKYIISLTKEPKKFTEKVSFLYANPNEKSHDEIEFLDDKILDRYSAPVLGGNKKNYGRIWIFRDITKQKNLEKTILREHQEQQTILDSIPAWVFYKNTDNHFIRVNKTFADAMNTPREEMEGKSLFDIYPKDQADKYLADDNYVIKTGKPRLNIIETMKTPKGLLWIKVDKVPYLDANGKIIGIIGFAIDITAQKMAEDKIKKHNEEMEKMNQFMVGRELKMVELKQEIAELKKIKKTD